jgi:phospholipid transport system substrate-binding protein
MRKILLFVTVLLLSGLGIAHAEVAPEELVRKTTEDILKDIRLHRDVYNKDYAKLYKMADEKVLLHFDFQRMSQWVLGRFWKQATSEQRVRFSSEFRDLLVGTYSQALLNYTDQKIIYLPVQRKPDDTDVTVKTEVKQSGGQPNIPIYFSLYKNREGAWKVYDITIEGVSLVTNYRSVYATKIREKGMDSLIAEIADNNKQKRAAGMAKN